MTPGNGDRDFEAGLLEELGDVDPELLDRYREIQAEDERTGDAEPAAVADGGRGDAPAPPVVPAADDAPPADRAEPVAAAALFDVEELLSKPLPAASPEDPGPATGTAVAPGGEAVAEMPGPDMPDQDEPTGAGEPAEPADDDAVGPAEGGAAAGDDAADTGAEPDAGGAEGPEEEIAGAGLTEAGGEELPAPPEVAGDGDAGPGDDSRGGGAQPAAAEEAPAADAVDDTRDEPVGETEGGGDQPGGPGGGDGGEPGADEAAALERPEAGDRAGREAPAVSADDGGVAAGPAGGLVERVLDHDEAFNRDIVTWLEGAGALRRALAARGIDDAALDAELGPGGRFVLDAWFALNGVRESAEVWEHWMRHVRQAAGEGRRHWSGRVVELLELVDVELGEDLGVDGGGGGWREALREVLPAAAFAKYRERVRQHAAGETDYVDRGLSVIDNLVDEYVGKERQAREAEELRRVRSELDSVKLDPTWRVAANHQMLREPGLAALFRRCAAVPGVDVEVPAVPAGTGWVSAAEQPFVWTEAPGGDTPVSALPAAVVVLRREAWEARAQRVRGRQRGGRPGAVRPGAHVATGVVLARVDTVAFQAREPGRVDVEPVEVEDVAAAAAAVAKGMAVEFSVVPVGGPDWYRPAAGAPEAVLPAARQALGVDRIVGVVMATGVDVPADLVEWYAAAVKDPVWVPVAMACGDDLEGAALGAAFERVSGYDAMGMAGGGADRR